MYMYIILNDFYRKPCLVCHKSKPGDLRLKNLLIGLSKNKSIQETSTLRPWCPFTLSSS